MAPSKSMQRSSSTTTTSSSSKCSCGNPVHPESTKKTKQPYGSSGSLPSPAKAISTATAYKRQRELRDFAQIDKLLSRIFWLRFYEDAARLYSARLTVIAKERLPFLIQNIIAAGGGPGWACANAASDEVREFFRLQIQVDFRELEDRVYHISSEWTYTAVRRMAISNGVTVSPAGLRATDLLNLIPLLEAMCEGLENAPKSAYEIHPVRAIAATFVNLFPNLSMTPATTLLSPAKKKIIVNHKMQEIPSLCTHHPCNKCAMDGPGSTAWGPSLYRITTSALGGGGGKSPSLKCSPISPVSPASVLFDALFPSSPLSPKRNPANGKKSSPSTPTSAKSANGGFSDTEMVHAQAELRSILSLGLSRLFIVLFQTAQEFDLRSFGESVNRAYGATGNSTASYDEDDYYGGCECCLEDFYNEYNRNAGPAYDDPLCDLWNSVATSAVAPPVVKRKSAKRARLPSGTSSASSYSSASLHNNGNPYASERSNKASFYKSVFSSRPGAGLRAWDTTLHYESVIREEEEEKVKKAEEKRVEKEKYGLKGNSPTTPTTKSMLQKTGANTLKENIAVESADGNGTGGGAMDIDAKPLSNKRRAGKAREGSECYGRGGGLVGWNSCHEEDVWERDLDSTDDFGIEDYFRFSRDKDDDDSCRCRRVAMRYLLAEEYKEDGNIAFKAGEYEEAISFYTSAHKSEPRLPIYLLNRAMAELKLNRWDEAEMDCTAVLRKHRCNAKALWRRAKARRAMAQLTGDVEKLIAAERDLLDFLSLLPTSAEGHIELASVRAELCPCYECTEQFSSVINGGDPSLLFCSTSSTAPPRSCFNKGYKPPAFLASSFSTLPTLKDTPLAKSIDVLAAPPRGWLSHSTGASGANGALPLPISAKMKNEKTAPATPTSAGAKPWFSTTPTGADRNSWQAFVQDFSLLPESVCSVEDRMPLRFVSDHDLASSTLPCWDLYRVVKAGK